MTLPTILGSFEDHLSSIPEMTEASLPHSKFMPPPKKIGQIPVLNFSVSLRHSSP